MINSKTFERRLLERWQYYSALHYKKSYDQLSKAEIDYLSNLYVDELKAMQSNEQIRLQTEAQFKAKRQAEDLERQTRDNELRGQQEDRLKAEAQYHFMQASPNASIEDFEKLYPAIRERKLIDNAKNEEELSYQRSRASYAL